tara:strand:+ start:4163 stop:5986 length:1824 start_codon:yes stop_codon:yes gene_type:complete
MNQDRNIKYINKEFGDFRQELIDYTKNYFPDTYNDFSPTSPGMMFIEMAAYVGDVLSFYQDTQLQETFLQYAKEPGNLYDLAYMMGYRPKTTTVAEAEIELTQNVGVVNTDQPNWNQALLVEQNAIIKSNSTGNVPFLIDKSVDFTFSSSYNPTEVTIASIDGGTGNPVEFTLKKKAKAVSSTVKTVTEVFTTPEKFTTITIDDSNIVGILDIVDENSNIWYEVPFLGQETVFTDTTNSGEDSNLVPYVLNLEKVPKRFVTRFNSQGQLQIQFGAGILAEADEIFTPDPTNVGLGDSTGISTLDKAYDPSNFLYTRTYGLAPANTTLTVRYLIGGGVAANVPANTLTQFTATVTATDTTYEDTLTFNNPKAATGGKDGDSIEELRQNSLRSFAEQGRAVTLQDYTIRAMSLPSKYGSVSKVYVTQDELNSARSTTDGIIDSNPLALSLYVLGYDSTAKVIPATENLKNNLKTYLANYIPVTDAVNIKDAFIVNIGVNFDILVRPNYNSRDVILKCTNSLIDYFNITKWNINQPINISNIYSLLDRVTGVQTVQKVEIVNKQGGGYSEYAYDIKGATRNNIVYPSYDTMIFELKFPNIDIKGRTTTLN